MTAPAPETPQALGVDRLLLVVTGSVSAAFVPYWVRWLRLSYPDLELRVVVTPTATRFVGTTALSAVLGADVLVDRWDDGDGALHVEWEQWAQAVVVHPATLDYLSRFSHGSGATPSLLAAQCTSAPVVLAPALPPGGVDSHAFRQTLELCAARRNVGILPTEPAESTTTGREDASAPGPLPEALRLVEQRRRELAEGGIWAAYGRTDPDVLERFGTGLLDTTVRRRPDGGHRWTRRPGTAAPAPFAEPDTALLRTLAADRGNPVAPALPTANAGESRSYDAPGPTSVAAALLEGAVCSPQAAAALAGILRGVGRTLRALHDAGPADAAPPGPGRGMTRLGDWLTGRARTPAGLQAAARTRQLVGGGRWDRLADWHRSVVTDSERVLLHGAPGLGSVVGDATFTGAVLLTGEDVCAGPWYQDVGWVLGEITELSAFAPEPTSAAWSGLAAALFDGYGRDGGPRCNVMATLRIALHLHDNVSYTDHPDAVDELGGLLCVLLDAQDGARDGGVAT